MYVLLAYDIGEKRVGKALKACRRYLTWRQRSLFEGRITESKLKELMGMLVEIVDVEEDSVCIYAFSSVRYARKAELGVVTKDGYII